MFIYIHKCHKINRNHDRSWFRLGITYFFLIYINDLSDGLLLDVKHFADDTSLLSIVNCTKASAKVLDSDLLKIQDWAYKWKMSFNPDWTKQGQELLRKNNKITNPPLYFNNVTVKLMHELNYSVNCVSHWNHL